MMDAFPEEHELVGFFGVEPTLTDPDLPWMYNDATFRIEVEGRPFEATINGGYGDLDIRWGAPGEAAISLTLRDVQGLRVERSGNHEWLVANFREALSLAPLRLQVAPGLRLLWTTDAL
jgi:hypothetical protein